MNYTITPNKNFNSLEVSFEGIPSKEIREALKKLKFKWHSLKKVWYGYTDENTLKNAIDNLEVYKKETREDVLKEFTYHKIDGGGSIYNDGWGGNKEGGAAANKQIKAYFHRIYPDIKISARYKSFSMCSEDRILIYLSKDHLKTKEEMIAHIKKNLHYDGWYCYKTDNGEVETIFGNKLVSMFNQNNNDPIFERIANYELECALNAKYGNNNTHVLNELGQQIMKDIRTIGDAYTHDCSTAMVDYFDHGCYMEYEYIISKD